MILFARCTGRSRLGDKRCTGGGGIRRLKLELSSFPSRMFIRIFLSCAATRGSGACPPEAPGASTERTSIAASIAFLDRQAHVRDCFVPVHFRDPPTEAAHACAVGLNGQLLPSAAGSTSKSSPLRSKTVRSSGFQQPHL